MRGRLAGKRKCYLLADQNNRHLGLRTGQRQAQAFFAGQERSHRKCVQNSNDSCIIKGSRQSLCKRRYLNWLLIFRQELKSACNVTT